MKRSWSIIQVNLLLVLILESDFSEGTNVTLTSNLNAGNIAYDGQTVTFLCTTRGTGTILSWVSEDYIGTGGAALEFFSVHRPETTDPSPTNPNTVATLISTNTDANGVIEIVSKLRIRASMTFLTSSVGCRVNGHGTPSIIEFSVVPSNVQLTSNLTEGNIAYDGQTVKFRCVIRGTGTILSWVSEDYIGTGGTALEFFSVHRPETTDPSPTNPNTVATLITATPDADTGVVHFVSELRIEASVQYQTSSVGCRVNGRGTTNAINFRVVAAPPTTVAMIEDQNTVSRDVSASNVDKTTGSPQQQKDSSFVTYVAAGGGICLLALVIIIIITAISFIIKKRRNELKKNSIEPKNIESCPPKGNNSTHKRSPSDESDTSKDSNDPLVEN